MADARTWQYRGRHSWHSYTPEINEVVDNAYSSGCPSVQFAINGEVYTVSFESMKQQCDADPSRVRNVRPPRQHTRNDAGVIWQHKGRQHWQDFPASISDEVEEAYCAGDITVDFVLLGDIYEIDFERMKQRCVNDPSRARDVRRCGGDAPMPSPKAAPAPAMLDNRPAYWDLSLNGVGCTRVPCNHMLVSQMQTLFNHTQTGIWTRDRGLRAGRPSGVPAGYRVQAIWRLQDRERWTLYRERRAAIAQICQARPDELGFCNKWRLKTSEVSLEATDLDQMCNEVYLFHGAPEAAIMAIVDNGIDVSKARSDGLLGGSKVYLTENSTKADEYTGLDAHNHYLLVCRTTLGIYHYTEEPAPDKDALNAKLRTNCHSVWAHRRSTTGLNEIAIANALQVYPEYLVHYNRR